MSIPNIFYSGKKLFHKCNPADFKFCPSKFSPYGVMLNFLCFFVLFNAVKTDSKLTLHHLGKIFIIQLTDIKFKIWRVTFFKSLFTTMKLWDRLGMDVESDCISS